MSRQDFFEGLADRWDDLHPVEPQLPAIRRGLELVGPLGGCAIADVGCGTGVLMHEVLPRLGDGRVVAIDSSAGMVARARAKFPDARIRWSGTDLFAAGIAEASIDVVLCYNTFPHFPDRARVLAEWARWLVPGGRAIIWHSLGREQLAELHRRAGEAVSDDLLPAPAELAGLFAKEGFESLHASESPDSYTVVARKRA
ncbi:MAG: class I SAM-dependent methyltransferase [Myxococcales bacterium]|jgi:SAM-dependent methyltransferase